jgi:methyltransferase (TIGR00027 family)
MRSKNRRIMRGSKASSSAATVTLARAHVNRLRIIDDPYAEATLSPRLKLTLSTLQRWPLSEYGRSATFSFLAARTIFFDEAVQEAIRDGVRQVVILGAGYDARAWRLRQPGVQFFEVDHPATQREKRQRAPTDGEVTYVAADLRDDGLAQTLERAGLSADQRSVFIAEGLTMYLTEGEAEKMFAGLAAVAPADSRLAANFVGAGGGSVAPLSRAVAKVIRARWRLSGETMYHWATRNDVPNLLGTAGWNQSECLSGPAVVTRYLSNTSMSVSGINPESFCVSAVRADAAVTAISSATT